MKNSVSTVFNRLAQGANQWLMRTPERALDEAYEAAMRIKAIEDNHFNGARISVEYGNYGRSTMDYFQSELRKYLNIAKVRLAEFRASNTLLRLSNRSFTEVQMDEADTEEYRINIIDKPALILRKLNAIDEIIARYSYAGPPPSAIMVVSENSQKPARNGKRPTPAVQRANGNSLADRPTPLSRRAKTEELVDNVESIADKTGVLPRSILKSVERVKRELDPNAERDVVDNYRRSKMRTTIAVRLVLLLVIIPLLVQQVSKSFVVGPIVDRMRTPEASALFINMDMEEEALTELNRYEERLRFERLIGKAPDLTDEKIEESLKERAVELAEEFRLQSNDAIKNVFSDMLAGVAFMFILVNSREEIEILKSFIDELVYGLSDSAKAFIIILFTDMFVGFHSPHGWEVLLDGVARHFGLEANHDFIFLFIATFPVILDTIFKYWIFRYLNRISPSAVATYRNMNE
ncbi:MULTISPECIES: proton extrusion protein PcxA [unclassified Leptolyngbya]|uniref:proton extrusion protein PcxA n=1 Tax=unclassified Leptolyngbya TaxID=2650499 RepID=UPI0016835B5F|nr:MULTISPECIES: proton extrusion protein PcxA [unclassified Leptolyngbya]MBD1911139.1 proton extrusion protein PcxA [Leptolyngbya sp. FACHB-8]MBD2154338.1 proton extrusion protein PcxA [Leptolyngbya sp. FACHB-16]